MTEPEPPPSAFSYIAVFMQRNNVSKQQFAENIKYPVDHVTKVLKGTRPISHECAFAIGQAYPQLRAEGLLHAQAKWRLHQLAHPELYSPGGHSTDPRRRTSQVDDEEVKRLYLDPEIPITQIARRTGASVATIYRIVDRARIPRRNSRHPYRRAK